MTETLISVDIETTGTVVGQDNIASIGACVVGNTKDQFYIELKPFTDYFNPQSVEVGKLTVEYLKKNGVEIYDALERFKEWLELHDHPVLVAGPTTFDISFLKIYFTRFLGYWPNAVAYNAIDIRSYAMAVLKIPFWQTSKKFLSEKIVWDGEHTHNALDDSIEQANLIQTLMKIRKGFKK
ncbi:MAG: exonuclease domain-containing protein [Candidatus Hodarchaeales archaeon]